MRRTFSVVPKRTDINRYHLHRFLKNGTRFTSTTTQDTTTTTATTSSKQELGLNEGVIEGVWLFHRHGDRTPARSLVAEHMYKSEASFWEETVPPMDQSYYRALSVAFPADVHESNNGGVFLDAGREPYGLLTWKGMDQMYERGREFRLRYDTTTTTTHHTSTEEKEKESDFLDNWNIKAYSTNYLRTIMSAQCFLEGFISTTSSSSSSSDDESSTNESFSFINTSLQDLKNRTHPTRHNPIKIQVRDRQKDTLNAFDKHPQLMKQLVENVVTTSEFVNTDSKAAPLAAKLANLLPGLGKASNYGGPSGINWIHATDHFICRNSHGLEYSKFSTKDTCGGGAGGGDNGSTNDDEDKENKIDDSEEQMLIAMRHPTVAHLSWRFRKWYQSPPLLAAIAGPPLGEIDARIQSTRQQQKQQQQQQQQQQQSKNDSNEKKKKPLVIYSCHDVTLLSLLYGIGADFVSSSQDLIEANVDPGSDQRWRYWPTYATTLAFELVRIKDDVEDEDSHRVRILLNGKPVKVIASLKKTQLKDTDSGLSPSDFSNIIQELKERGDICSTIEKDSTKTDNSERDMSTWTG